MRLQQYLNEPDIHYSNILTNFEILKNKKLVNKLKKLNHKSLKGGFDAIFNYPKENQSKIVIVYDKDKPVGWISVTDGYQNIFVDSKYRKTGIASKLKDILYKR